MTLTTSRGFIVVRHAFSSCTKTQQVSFSLKYLYWKKVIKSSQFICTAHLKTTGVDTKCFPVKEINKGRTLLSMMLRNVSTQMRFSVIPSLVPKCICIETLNKIVLSKVRPLLLLFDLFFSVAQHSD